MIVMLEPACRSEAAVQKGLVPLQQAFFIQRPQQRAPRLQPHCAYRKLRLAFKGFSNAHVTMLHALVFLSSPPLKFDPSTWMLLILRLLASDDIFENHRQTAPLELWCNLMHRSRI